MQLYNPDFKTLAKLLLIPVISLVGIIAALIMAMMDPFETNKGLFQAFRTAVFGKMSYNSQVCYLRKMLNDLYDDPLRRIYLEDAGSVEPLWVYARLEDQPVMIEERAADAPVMVNSRDNIWYGSGFIVYVPNDLNSLEEQIKASLNYYKLATKKYQIIYF